MTLDSSAIVAMVFAEPGYLDLVDCMLGADTLRIGAPTLVETGMVVAGRLGSAGASLLSALLQELDVAVVPFGEREWRDAATACARFGCGRHRAALNFGDCLAYATARAADDTLLFVGDDVRHTDIAPAL
jgi:ribonuclease VapC